MTFSFFYEGLQMTWFGATMIFYMFYYGLKKSIQHILIQVFNTSS